jgi:DNA-binding NarL/FixJ family response regulator
MAEPTLSVLCVDDQRTFVDALHLAVDSDDNAEMRCAGSASSVAEAIEVMAHTAVDVVVMDFDLPDVDGIEGTRRLKSLHPDVRVIILTGLADLDIYLRALSAGADGFFAKDMPVGQLLSHIRSSAVDGLALDHVTRQTLRARVGDHAWIGGRTWRPDLTEREKEVLALLAAGVDSKSIARHLDITIHTCRSYVRNILVKLGAHSQLEAVAIAHHAGLLSR